MFQYIGIYHYLFIWPFKLDQYYFHTLYETASSHSPWLILDSKRLLNFSSKGSRSEISSFHFAYLQLWVRLSIFYVLFGRLSSFARKRLSGTLFYFFDWVVPLFLKWFGSEVLLAHSIGNSDRSSLIFSTILDLLYL